MRVRAIRWSFVIGVLAVASCTLGVDDKSLSDESSGDLSEEGAIGSIQQSLAKGKPGAVNGSIDYCNDPASPCSSGEGDCDSNAQCAPGVGLICVPNNGPRFGFASSWDVCAAVHCANNVLDGDETGIDCGGSCGTCSGCLGTPSTETFCSGCQCVSGQGDCDSSSECAAGLICATDNGALFGLPRNYDVCVPPHCTNDMLDAASGETGIDSGGPCGTRASTCTGTPGATDFCVGCQCASGEGDCDSNAECATGLACAVNNGPRFGLPAGYDVCVPAHCTNRALDAASGETGVDKGGPCGTPPCGNGVVNSGEVCDDGVNDGVLCSSNCSTETQVALIRWDCSADAGVITALQGTGCVSFPGSGASYITFSSSSVQVTLFSNGDCTGRSTTVTSDNNFCQHSFDQGGGLNDAVQSAKVSRR
jgi:hypothetical protein